MSILQDRIFGVATQADMAGLTGLEILQAMIDGKLPAPTISRAMNFILVEVRAGFAVFEGETSAELLNPQGTVHGGWALTLIDSATGCATQTLMPAGSAGYTTVETKANMTRPILHDTGRVRCEGRVINQGRQIVTAEARITDSTGRLMAHGTSTMIVLQRR